MSTSRPTPTTVRARGRLTAAPVTSTPRGAPWLLALGALAALALLPQALWAGDLPGGSIQAAITAASPGDVIEVPPGVYEEDLDFQGKAVTVRGAGAATVVRGTGTGPVVTFASGEGPDSVLDGLTLTGGAAVRGGGVLIDGASPTVIRCRIVGNTASSQGSGIQVQGGGAPRIFNNLVGWNGTSGFGDPHGIQVSGSSPAVVNNTIVRHDSNGVFLSGSSAALVLNNVIAWNGGKVAGDTRGRGICDFSGGNATLRNNLFHRNRIAAVLRGGKDWKRIAKFQKNNPEDVAVQGNVDGNPGFVRRPPGDVEALSCHDAAVCDVLGGRAVDVGHDDPACDDTDGSRNTAGHTGGPFAAGVEVPDGTSCGMALLAGS